MPRRLVIAGGVINAMFFLFHLAFIFALPRTPGLEPAAKNLLQIFNACTCIFIGYLAYVSLFHARALLATPLGAYTLVLGALTYLVRIITELRFTRPPGPLVIAFSALAAGAYLVALIANRRPHSDTEPAAR